MISLGAALGANCRGSLVHRSKSISIGKHWITFWINISSSFLLGFLISFYLKLDEIKYSPGFFLFSTVGFLGGFSTFSTLMFELFSFLKNHQFNRFIYLSVLSIGFGLFAAYLGYLLGN